MYTIEEALLGANNFPSPVKTQTEKDERNKSITNQC